MASIDVMDTAGPRLFRVVGDAAATVAPAALLAAVLLVSRSRLNHARNRLLQLLHGLDIQRICAFFISNMAHEQYFPSYHHALPDILSAPAPIAPYGTVRHHSP